MRERVALPSSQLPLIASLGRCFPPGLCGSACRSVDSAAGALSCAILAPARQPLALVHGHDGSIHLRFRCPSIPARRDTRIEAPRLRRLSPLQTLEDQSQVWGIGCHSCTWREGLAPSWKTELQDSSSPCGLPGSQGFLSTNGSHGDLISVGLE